VKQIEQLTELLRVQVCIDYFFRKSSCSVSCQLRTSPGSTNLKAQ